MTQLTANRPTEFLGTERIWRTFGVAEDAVIWAGALVAVNTDGYLVPASEDPTLHVVGIASTEMDATDLANGDMQIEVESRICLLDNDNTIAANHVEALCYAVDDQTVSISDGSTPGVPQVVTATVVYDAGSATGFTITGVGPAISVNAAVSAAATALALANLANGRADFAALYVAVPDGATIQIAKKTAGTFVLTKQVSGSADITQVTDVAGVAATAANRPVAGRIHIVGSRGVYVRVLD